MTGTGARAHPGKSARERMVLAAVKLIRVRGVSGTGLREIVQQAQAPRGSLQHYFPEGKEQLIREAVLFAGDFAGRRVAEYAAQPAIATPGDLFAAMAGEWREMYAERGFTDGCPLAATTADTAATSPAIRGALGQALDRWLRPVEQALAAMGVPAHRTGPVALLMISALEGALILARAREDLGPLTAVIDELRPVLDACPEDRASPG